VNNFPGISLDFVVKMGYIIPMIKNGKKQNVVSTTRKQNLAAAKACDTYNEAVSLFRALQHANDMGTHGGDFDEFEEHFINKQGLSDYVYNGLKQSEKD
jgi:hypothetical protein